MYQIILDTLKRAETGIDASFGTSACLPFLCWFTILIFLCFSLLFFSFSFS